MQSNNLDHNRHHRTNERTDFEDELGVVTLTETIFLYRHTHGDSGVMTIAGVLFAASVVCMFIAYWPKWINMPVTIKNYRQLELKSRSGRVASIIISLFPAFFANKELMSGTSGTVLGIGFTILLVGVLGYFMWKIEQAAE